MTEPARRNRILEPTESANEGAFTAGDWGLFVAISMIWGSSFLFIAVGLDAIEPGLITWGRVALGAAVLNVLPRLAGVDRPGGPVPDGRSCRVVWVGVPFTLFPLAEQHINSAVTGMLNGSQPIFAALVAGVLLRRPPTRSAGGRTGRRVGRRGAASRSARPARATARGSGS